ncbi:MAG TPA: PTS sugar transporter subunit IIA [Pelolinea sp.]|nr:PTS sugar transporter subunit IIA [Pelolinea sp.]
MPETTAFDIEVDSWEDAVEISGELLLSAGFVEYRYIQAMIDSVKAFGAYIVIAPGVALPHARPEDGVLVPCMSLVTLKEPLNFGNIANDPVKIVFSFGTTDNKTHIEALKSLARIIGDPKKLNFLKHAISYDSVKKIIDGKLI